MANKISAPFIQYTTSVKLSFQNVCGMLLDVHIAFIMNAESISSQSLFFLVSFIIINCKSRFILDYQAIMLNFASSIHLIR